MAGSGQSAVHGAEGNRGGLCGVSRSLAFAKGGRMGLRLGVGISFGPGALPGGPASPQAFPGPLSPSPPFGEPRQSVVV